MRIGANPFADLLAQELADSRRVAARTDLFTAFVPFAARWPVEMHVYPNRLVANLIGLDDAELDGSAQTLSRYPSTVRPAVSHPAALHFGTAQYADTDTITARSDREAGQVVIPLGTTPGDVTAWAAYVAGVVWALRDTGQPVRGGTVSITSDVEMGSGLASSAALECAVLGAPVPEPRSIGSSRPGSHSAPRMNMSVPQWVCWINSPRCSANHNGRC